MSALNFASFYTIIFVAATFATFEILDLPLGWGTVAVGVFVAGFSGHYAGRHRELGW